MKARHEFKTDKEYEEYLRVYFIGQILPSIKSNDEDECYPEYLDCAIVNFVESLIRVIKL